jgi:hypothetical protein
MTFKKASPIIKSVIQDIKDDGDIEEIFEDLGDDTEQMLEDLENDEDDANQGTDEETDEKEKALEDSLKVLEGVE